jgi:RHS repeat-associated protein
MNLLRKREQRCVIAIFTALVMFLTICQPALVRADVIKALPPSSFKAEALITAIDISWQLAKGTEGCELEVDGKIIAMGDKTFYRHDNLIPGSSHVYRIRAKNKNGPGEWSAVLSVKTQNMKPSTPKDFKITNVTNSTVAMTWSEALGAATYEVEVDGKVIESKSKTSFVKGGFDPESKHTFRVRAKNELGESDWTNGYEVTNFPNSPDTPKNLKLKSINNNSITIVWDKSDKAEGYEVVADNKLIDNGQNNEFTHKGISVNDEHAYFVRAKNSGGVSEWSSGIKIKIPTTEPKAKEVKSIGNDTNKEIMLPTIPSNITLKSTENSITVNWDISRNAELYDIEVDGNIISNLKENTYTQTDLLQGTSHSYRIRAKTKYIIGAWSSLVTGFTKLKVPDVPKNLNANSVSSDCIVAAWDMVTGATGYDLEVDEKVIDVGINIKYVNTQLKEASTHYYRVRAKNSAGNSEWSEKINTQTLSKNKGIEQTSTENQISQVSVPRYQAAEKTAEVVHVDMNLATDAQVQNSVVQAAVDTTAPTAPSSLSLVYKTYNSVNIKWNASTDNVKVTSYDIYNGSTKVGSTTTGTTYTVTGLLPSTSYSLTVKARDAAGNTSASSNTLTVTTSVDTTAPSAPTSLTTSTKSCTSVSLSWAASTDNVGVAGYDVYNGSTKVGSTTTGTTYTVMGLLPNTRYSFTVKARDAAGNASTASSALAVTTLADTTAPSAPTNLTMSTNSCTSVGLSWTAATDNLSVTGYDVYNGSTKVGTTTTATTYTITGLLPNTSYSFTVKARDAAGNTSSASSELAVTTLADTTAPSAPTNLVASNKSYTSVSLSWTASTDNVAVTGYDVYDGTLKVGSTTNTTTYVVNGLIPNTSHQLTVKARDYAGNTSVASSSLEVTTLADTIVPTAPTNLVVSDRSYNSVSLSWMESSDNVAVTGYDIYVGSSKVGSTTNANTYTVSGLMPNTSYQFTVQARDAAGNISLASTSLSVTTDADTTAPTVPGNFNVVSKDYSSISLSWTASIDNVGVIAYDIYIGTTKVGQTNDQTNYTITGLTPDTSYSLTVKARDLANNTSLASTALVVITNADTQPPTVPSNLTVTSHSVSEVVISWSQSTDNIAVIEYEVFRDGIQVASLGSEITNYKDSGLNPNTQFKYTIKAKDKAGNLSCESDAVSITTEVDNIAPSKPDNISCIIKDGNTFNLLWDGSTDNGVIAGYDIYCNGNKIGSTIDTNYIYIGKQFITDYIFTVKARDLAGNTSEECRVYEQIRIGLLLHQDLEIDNDINFYNSGYINLDGHTLTVNGSVNMLDGVMDVNGGKLFIHGNFEINNTSRFYMKDSSDYVCIDGNFSSRQTYSIQFTIDVPLLTDGILEIKGDFSQVGNYANFEATGNHLVVFSGTNIQNISFDNVELSHFQMMDVSRAKKINFKTVIGLNNFTEKTNLNGITDLAVSCSFNGYLKNYNDVSLHMNITFVGGLINLTSNLTIYGDLKFLNKGYIRLSNHGNLTVFGNLYCNDGGILISESGYDDKVANLYVNGNYNSNGGLGLNINGGNVFIQGDLNINGENSNVYLGGKNTYVCVNGSVLMGNQGYYIDIINGAILEVKGDFIQSTYSEYSTDIAGIVILSGVGIQHISLYDPLKFKFDVLVINKPLSEGYVFNTTQAWSNLIEISKSVDSFFGIGSADGAYGPTGNFAKSFTDLKTGNDGSDAEFTRTYNSKDVRETTGFGKGWSFSYECSITNFSGNISTKVVRLPDGSTQTFKINTDGTFTAMDSRNTLTKQGDGSYILSTKDQHSYGFNSNGYLVWVKDKNGNATTINVDSNGKVTSIVDEVGRNYNISYNDSGLISGITDCLGRVVKYEYDNKKLVKVTDPMNHYTTYSYDSYGFLTEIRAYDNSLIESITYNHNPGQNKDKVDHTIDQYGKVLTYSYDPIHFKTIITDSNGRQTVQTFDSSFNIISSTDAEGKVTTYEYNKDSSGVNNFNEQKTITDRNGGITRYERDSVGNITKVTNPDGSYKEYVYDSKNNVIREKDENGNLTFYIYDSNGTNMVKQARPLNGTDIYSDSADQTKFAITQYIYYSDSEAQSLGYRAKGLLKQVIDPMGGRTTYTYDSYENVLTVTDGENNTTTYEYNSIGWKTKATSPQGYLTEYFYDNNGNVEKTVLNNSSVTRTVYDSLGRVIKVISSNVYDSSKDDLNNHDYLADAGTRYTYYSNGKVKTATDAENNTTTYTYDLYGNKLTETKANGAVYRYEYDVMNRISKVYFKADSASTEQLLLEYAYGILTSGSTTKTETKYVNTTDFLKTITTLDYAGRVTSIQNPDNTTLTKAYNANGTLSSSKDANGNITYYKYDGLNRLIAIYTPFENINGAVYYSYTAVEYDKAGRKTKESFGKTTVIKYGIPQAFITTAYEYYNNGKLKVQSDSAGRRLEYTYDKDGNIVTKVVKVDDNTNRITEYTNNEFGKPTTMKVHVYAGDIYNNEYTNNSDLILTTTYTYDKEGNVLTEAYPDSSVVSYTYDKLGRILSTSSQGKDEYDHDVTITTSQTYNWEGKVLTKTDGNGNTTTYVYDARGFLVKMVDAKGNTTAYYYDLAGRKIAEVSPNNYDSSKTLQNLSRTEYNYDLMDRVKTKVSVYFDKVSNSFTTITSQAFKYDNNGNVVKELDAVGYEAGTGSTIDDKISSGYGKIYSYNLANKLLTILDADSQDRLLPYTKRYTYDGTGRKITETDGKGKVTTWYYDDANNITKTTIKRLASEAEVTVSSATYNSTGDVITATDGNGNITTYEYTGFGKVKKVAYPGDSTIAAYYVIYQYDTVGRVIRKQDSVGVANIYTYDSEGRELTSTEENVDGTEAIEVATTYDKNGNKRFLTDGNGVVTENVYDELNKLVTSTIYVTDGSGNKVKHTTSYIYDKNNNLLKEIDWLGNEKTYVYDALDRVVEKYDQNNKLIQKLEYYHNGTQSKSYDALQNVTLYYYDKNNRLIKTVDSEGHITLQHYDEVGNIDQKTDGDNNTTYYSYDQYNRLVSVKNAKGEITNYTYDLNGNMLTEVDAQGNITTFEYNVANKLIRKIFHGGRTGSSGSYTYDPSKTESYTYYANSDLRTKVDRNGVTSTYTYDIHGRKTSEAIGSITNSFGYDNNGNQIRITDATGTTTRTYDELNRVISKSVPTVGTIVYKYDIVSGIVGLDSGNFGESETDPKGNVTLKIYDKAGRIKKVIAGDDTTTYNYYDNGSLNSVVYPNGYSEEYTYYKDKLLRTLVNKAANGTVIESYSYTYDNAHNMLSKTDNKGTTSYTYDELNRLKTVTEPSGKVTTYTYTSAGNRNTETVVEGSNTTVKTYTYDSLNRLLSIIVSLNTVTVENTAYTYDNNGNQLTSRVDSYVNGLLQSSSVTTNVYDNLNQLIQTTTPDNTTIKNIYNGECLRVGKQVGNSSTKYLYSSDKVVLELDGNGNLIGRDIYGINLLERIADNSKAYFFYNGHADTTKLIAQDGTVLNSYYYDAFGNITDSNENMDNPYRYAGYQYDKETKTYYVIARMYDPSTGRFLQEDSYSGDIKDPLSLNLYVYVNNNPMTYDDPNGHWPSFINNIVSTVSSAASSAWSYVKEKASDFYSWGSSAISSAENYISNKVDYVASKASSAYNWGKEVVSDIGKTYNTAKTAYKVSKYLYENVVKPDLKKQDEELKKRIQVKASAIGELIKKGDYYTLLYGKSEQTAPPMPVSNVKDDYLKPNLNGNIGEKLLYVWSKTLYPGLDAISKWEENNSGALNNVSMAMMFIPGGMKSPIVAEEAVDRKQSQIEIRERVLKNIEESKTAREASNYSEFAEFENRLKGAGKGKDIVGSTFNDIKPTQDMVNPEKVAEYVNKLKSGEYVEPIEVVETPGKGKYIVEGHHRYVASQQTGIPVEIKIRQGNGPTGLPDWSEVQWKQYINEDQFWGD